MILKVPDKNTFVCRLNMLIASLFLFEPHYLSATFLFLRTAKLLSLGTGLCISAYLIWNVGFDGKWRYLKEVLAAFAISMLCTVDEQLVAVLPVLAGAFALEKVFEGGTWSRVRIAAGAMASYGLYHVWWGRKLFEKYTPAELAEHPHTFGKAINNLPANMFYGMLAYFRALKFSLFDSWIGVAVFTIVFLAVLYRCRLKIRLISIWLAVSAVILSAGLVSAHPAVYGIPELAGGMYFIIPMFLTFFAFWHAAFNLNISFGRLDYAIVCRCACLFFLCVNFAYACFHVKKISLSTTTHNGACIIQEEGVDTLMNYDRIIRAGIDPGCFEGLLCTPEEYNQYLNGAKD